MTVDNQNYYEVVQPLLYITYCGFIKHRYGATQVMMMYC